MIGTAGTLLRPCYCVRCSTAYLNDVWDCLRLALYCGAMARAINIYIANVLSGVSFVIVVVVVVVVVDITRMDREGGGNIREPVRRNNAVRKSLLVNLVLGYPSVYRIVSP